ATDATPVCRLYLEQVATEPHRHSSLARAIPFDVVFGLDVHGPGGGKWSCHWTGGRGLEVRGGLTAAAALTYRTNLAVFDALVRGRQSPHRAFFDGDVQIDGDVEKALVLAPLIEQFLTENPYRPPGQGAA